MNLLGAILYDPSTAANKATTAAAVMAVCDATNLALAITVPAHGKVFVRMRTVIDGAATFPQILLGVMNHTGGAVLGRVSPLAAPAGTALATTRMPVVAEFIMTGLTPGALTLDAAFGVELGVTSSAIRWGGPNNTTASDAWGAFCFEAWDPAPAPTNWSLQSIDANGRVDVIKVAGTTQTARDLGASVLLSAGTGTGQLDFTSGVVKANLAQILGTALTETAGQIAAGFKKFFNIATPAATMDHGILVDTVTTTTTATTATNLTNAPTAGDFTAAMKTSLNAATPSVTVSDKTGFSLSAAGVQAIWDALTSALTTVGSIGKLLVDNINATISSRLATTGYTAPLDAAGTRSAVGLAAANLDTQLAALDTDILTRLATSGYTAPDNASVAAVKAQTDKLTFTVANQLDANIQSVNDVLVTGNGSVATPWGP